MKTMQEVKMKFCIWKPHNGHETDNAKYYMPACVDIVHNLHGEMFKFCPHCGGEIKWDGNCVSIIKPIHPGTILEELMKPMGFSTHYLGGLLNISHTRLDEIINGKRAITKDIAKRLTSVFKISSSFWMELQKDYEIDIAKIESPQKEKDCIIEEMFKECGINVNFVDVTKKYQNENNMEKVDIKMSKLLDKIYDYKCDYKEYCDNYEDTIEKCRKLYFENMEHFDKILDMGNSENVVFMYISWKLYNYYHYIIIEKCEDK
jgi:addiction module HigA family antidote